MQLGDLIPLESKRDQGDEFNRRKRLIVGHNVAFDRSYVKEQYFLEVRLIFSIAFVTMLFLQGTELRFLDTMSMHIATSGYAHVQRISHMKNKKNANGEDPVEKVTHFFP